MTDHVTTAETTIKTDASKVESAVIGAAQTVETDVESTWAKVKPWLTHILAVISGYLLANASVVAAAVSKLL